MTYAHCYACKEFLECENGAFFGWPGIEDGEHMLCEKCKADLEARAADGVEVITRETTGEDTEVFLHSLTRAAKDIVFRRTFKKRIADPDSKEAAGFMSAITALHSGKVSLDGRMARYMRRCGLLGEEKVS